MVTKDSDSSSASSSTPTPQEVLTLPTAENAQNENDQGFFPSLVKSVFEPGANAAVVMAMNICFFLLIITLFGLAFLTNWNKHVFLLLGVTTLLWGSMIWFVVQVTQLQTRPDNMPPDINMGLDIDTGTSQDAAIETKKDQ